MAKTLYICPRDTPGPRYAFSSLFCEVFRGAPYFERHSPVYVRRKVWKPHIERGIVVLAYQEERAVGFGSAISLIDPYPVHVLRFLTANGFEENPALTWYMSELGVLEDFRRQGIGAGLIRERLLLIRERGATHYCFQTARENSYSEPLYRKIGAVEFGEESGTDSKYFIGSCAEALAKL